jgi:hypothetical protein
LDRDQNFTEFLEAAYHCEKEELIIGDDEAWSRQA